MVEKINEELNEDQSNKYSEETDGPIMLLEEKKSFRIKKAMGDKHFNNKK